MKFRHTAIVILVFTFVVGACDPDNRRGDAPSPVETTFAEHDSLDQSIAKAEREAEAVARETPHQPTAESIRGRVLPPIDEAQTHSEKLRAAIAALDNVMEKNTELTQTNIELKDENEKLREDVTYWKDASQKPIRKWLTLSAILGLVGIPLGVVIALKFSKTIGAIIAVASAGVAGASILVTKYLIYIAWGGAALLGLSILCLGYLLWREYQDKKKREEAYDKLQDLAQSLYDAFRQVVKGGKDYIQKQQDRGNEAIVNEFKDTHRKAQDEEVQKLVKEASSHV